MDEPQGPQVGLTAQPIENPQLEAINDQIAELVAEALFHRLVKNVLENKVKHGKISGDAKTSGQPHHG